MEKLSNNHIKELAKLKQKKYREQTGRIIVEGFRLIEQVINNGLIPEEIYISNPEKYDLDLFQEAKLFQVQPWQLDKITDTKTPQDIAALVVAKTRSVTDTNFILYLDRISEPGNLGTIIRTAAAAGISGIVLSPGSCEVFNPKVIRASLGTIFSMPIEIHDYAWLKSQTAKLIVTTLEEATNLFELQPPKNNMILVMGSEAFGVSPDIIEMADIKVKIPISGKVESLNVAIATGISMFYLINR